jgi:tetratricopeptide (TPR) repeat protein
MNRAQLCSDTVSSLPGSEYTIDPVSLRAKPVDPVAMEHCAHQLQDQAQQLADPIEGARRASYAGLLFALLGDCKSAKELIEFALARQSGAKRLVDRTVTEIRLAQLAQFAGQLVEAQALLDPIIARCRSDPALESLLDFALQHQGKVLFDQGLFATALDCFNEALELRRIKQLPDLIASTELAIATTTRELERSTGGQNAPDTTRP